MDSLGQAGLQSSLSESVLVSSVGVNPCTICSSEEGGKVTGRAVSGPTEGLVACEIRTRLHRTDLRVFPHCISLTFIATRRANKQLGGRFDRAFIKITMQLVYRFWTHYPLVCFFLGKTILISLRQQLSLKNRLNLNINSSCGSKKKILLSNWTEWLYFLYLNTNNLFFWDQLISLKL